MHCASCARLIERQLQKTPGVKTAFVNFGNETATVDFENTTLNEITKVINASGYQVIDPKNSESYKIQEQKILTLRLIFSIALTVFVLVNFNFYLTIIFAGIIQFIIGAPFYQAAWSNLKMKTASMDTLVVVGTTAAFFAQDFMSSTVIITLILLGKFLEIRAKSKTSQAIKELIKLVPTQEIKVGDKVIVKPGERVPADGKIIEGESSVDESMISGESLPVDKKVGDPIIGGTINRFGTFTFLAIKVGEDTVLSQIIKLVSQAQGSKAPIEKLADQVSSYFVPVIIVISLVTFFFFGLNNAIAVLIVACPCALGLATPTALIVGMGRGAKRGILIKDAQILETAYKINTVVFDKTGTLTTGNPVVTFFKDKKTLQIAASLEQYSEHPLAKAIVQKAQEEKIQLLPVKKFRAIAGMGVEGYINNRKVFFGRGSEGIEIKDTLKDSAKTTIEALRKRKIDIWLITGDKKATAEEIAGQLGITNILAEVMPQDKAESIKRLAVSGKTVAFVGDGINDAPALAAADVGMAMGSGTGVAMETAGVTLMNSNLESVVEAIDLSKKTMTTIKMNLVWAFGYNLILIPLAIFGRVTPVMAAGAMALSSLSVVTNSLLLNRAKLNA